MKDELKRYAIIIAYVPKIAKKEIDAEIEKFSQLIVKSEGVIEKYKYLGLKPLAYTIKKYDSAHYVQFYFNIPVTIHLKDQIKDINRRLHPEINTNVIRHMIMKIGHSDFSFESLESFEGFDNNIKI